MSENTSDPDRIERDLSETRARLDGRLSELQERLSPGQILDDLMQYFRGSEGADFGRNLLDSVKTNPLPAAVTGIGLAWLMASGQRPQHALYGTERDVAPATRRNTAVRVSGSSYEQAQTPYDETTERLRTAEQGVVRQKDETESVYTARLDDARGHALGLARQAQETAESFSQRVKDAISSATHSVAQGASAASASVTQGTRNLRDQVSDAARSAGGQFATSGQAAQDLGGRLASTLSDNPILLGALGLAAGALLGALVPQSREEEDALGGIAGQVRDTARGAAQDAIDRGSRVAHAVVDTGQQSASEHGLAGGTSVGSLVDAALSGELAGNARQVAQDVLRTGHEAVRKEGLGEGQGSPKSSPTV
jgi:hypothetical protein